MIDKRKTEELRARIEKAARVLEPHERLWFEVRCARHTWHGARWKAAVCRPEDVKAMFAGAANDGAVFELDYPSQLAEWLETLGVRPLQPVPDDWNDLVFFGCDVEVCGPKSSTL